MEANLGSQIGPKFREVSQTSLCGISLVAKLEFSKLLSRVRFPYPAHMNNTKILLDRFYQHKDGGLYRVNEIGMSTVDQSKHVIYTHVYPFERHTWIRPLAEWTDDRFRLLTQPQAEVIMQIPAVILEKRIRESKAARTAAESK